MEKLLIAPLTVGELAANCYLLANPDTKEALVFDPGDEAGQILACARKNEWKIGAILLTHGHGDHMGAASELRELTGARIYAMREEEPLLLDAMRNLSVFIQHRAVTLKADEFLADGQELELCGVKLEVLLTPGHTPGGCCYYCAEAKTLFSGDTLFCGSVGRSDFPGGSMSALVRSVKEKIFPLPDDTRVCPGHGEPTTVGDEKRQNPFVQ